MKNVIKTIYKEINNEDINFINDSSKYLHHILFGKSHRNHDIVLQK